MNNLFTLLGEARAYLRIYAGNQVGQSTATGYEAGYARVRSGTTIIEDEASEATRGWLKAAARWGAMRDLGVAAAELEQALDAGDDERSRIAAAQARECLELLYRYPTGQRGRRQKGNVEDQEFEGRGLR